MNPGFFHASCRSEKVVIASAGMQADTKALHKMLQARHVMYHHANNRNMSVSAAAQLLSNTLYYKRFFPYYTFNLCAGLDEQGQHNSPDCSQQPCQCCLSLQYESSSKCWWLGTDRWGARCFTLCAHTGRGAVYNYDAIGSYELSGYFCQVSGATL